MCQTRLSQVKTIPMVIKIYWLEPVLIVLFKLKYSWTVSGWLAGWLAVLETSLDEVDVVPLFSSGTITRKEGKQWWNQLTWSGDGTDVSWLNIQYPDVTVLGYDKQAWNIQNGSYRSHRTPFLQSGVCYYQLWISGITNALASFMNIFLQTFMAAQGRKCRYDQIWINAFRIAFQCPTWSGPWLLRLFSCRVVLVSFIFIRKPRKTTANVELFRLDIRFMLRGVECVHKSLLACAYRFKPSWWEGSKLHRIANKIVLRIF